jgi:CheY-like chemotaxis protein
MFPAVAETARAPGLPPTASRHVLYIEDEPVNVMLMRGIFRLCPNWTLSTARDGAEGLRRAAQDQPDLVLVDMHLPDMNGLQLLERLRDEQDTRDLPCVALSADAGSDKVSAALRAGFDDYWMKPFDLAQLLSALSRKLGAPRA